MEPYIIHAGKIQLDLRSEAKELKRLLGDSFNENASAAEPQYILSLLPVIKKNGWTQFMYLMNGNRSARLFDGIYDNMSNSEAASYLEGGKYLEYKCGRDTYYFRAFVGNEEIDYSLFDLSHTCCSLNRFYDDLDCFCRKSADIKAVSCYMIAEHRFSYSDKVLNSISVCKKRTSLFGRLSP